ncbi:MAG: MMPL family transporter, partial [Syntrophorhabdales bacterium]
FFPFVLTGFKGLAELGIICAIGLVLATAATLCLLPALLVLFDRKKSPAKAVSAPSVRPFLRLSRTGALVIVVIALAGTGFSLHAARGLRFDLNMLRLQSRRAESVIWEKKLVEGSQRASIYGVILAHSLEEVDRKTKALKALPTVSEVVSAESLLPEDQREKLAIVHTMRPALAGIGQIPAPPESVDVSRLEETLGRIRFKMLDSSSSRWRTGRPLQAQMSEVRALIDGVVEEFHRSGPTEAAGRLKAFQDNLIADFKEKLSFLLEGVGAGTMGIGELPKTLQERYIGKDGLSMIQVFPKQDVWDPDLDTRFVRDLRSVDPDVVGDPVTLHVFTQAFRDASVKAALYALLFIAALLALTLRSPVSILLVLVPLAAGSIWTFGLMRLAGIELNLANSIFLPLILGAGVEYGIIVVLRWREANGGRPGWVCPSSTGWGVVLAGLSTTVGFGSLTISEHHGVHSLGLLTTIGSLSVLGAAVLFLPALIRLVPDRLNRRKANRCEDASTGLREQEKEEMRS